jgi:hypothetical protein
MYRVNVQEPSWCRGEHVYNPLLAKMYTSKVATSNEPVVSPELGISSVQAGVTEGLGLLNAVPVGFIQSHRSAF